MNLFFSLIFLCLGLLICVYLLGCIFFALPFVKNPITELKQRKLKKEIDLIIEEIKAMQLAISKKNWVSLKELLLKSLCKRSLINKAAIDAVSNLEVTILDCAMTLHEESSSKFTNLDELASIFEDRQINLKKLREVIDIEEKLNKKARTSEPPKKWAIEETKNQKLSLHNELERQRALLITLTKALVEATSSNKQTLPHKFH